MPFSIVVMNSFSSAVLAHEGVAVTAAEAEFGLVEEDFAAVGEGEADVA